MPAIDTNFSALMESVRAKSELLYQYLMVVGGSSIQRLWMVPTAAGWTFDPLDIPNMGIPFSRVAVNSQYAQEYAGGGYNKIHVVMALSIQLNYSAMMERAFRDRHKTVVRATAHLGGRKAAHGSSSGVHIASVKAHVQDLLNIS